jgi:lysozyme
MSLAGVDVSNWQGRPASWHAAAGHIDFAGVKWTELEPSGNRYVDPYAAEDWAWLRQQCKGRIAYMYGHPSMPASASVGLFASSLTPHGVLDTDAVALDLETTDGLTAAAVADWSATVLGMLRREFSRLPLCYTFRAFAEAGNCAGLQGYPLWIADPSAPAGHPRIPHPWKTHAIHQYAWQPLDKDQANYPTLAEFQAALGKTPANAPASRMEDRMFRVLSGANADDGITLPDDAKKIRLGAVGETTVSVQFHGHATKTGVKLGWHEGSAAFDVPRDSRLVRVFRPADGHPEVPVTLAVS